jgi:glycosyltransferase involved in cell wall biosynthesis
MSGRRRICILTPGALGSNPRVVKEAEALRDAGNEVTVVSTRTLPHVDLRDDSVLASAAWRSVRLDLRARGYGWRLRRAVQAAYATAFRLTGNGRLADRAFSAFTTPLIAATRHIRADLYIAHYPAALPAAALAARRVGTRYAFDAEDYHAGDCPEEPDYEGMRRLVRDIESRYLPGCAYVTAASPGIADAYASAYGIARPAVLLNVFPRAQAPPFPTARGAAPSNPSIYWFSQTIGPDRGLECAVRAIGWARTRPHLYLRGSPSTGFAERLGAAAAQADAAERLHILPPESPSEMARLAAVYDVGLASETGHTPNHRIALSNKQFTYLLAGVPAVMSDIPAHRAFAPEAGDAVRLYTTENPRSLAAVLDALLGDPAALANARSAAYRLAQTRFNWDVEKAALVERVAVAVPWLPARGES